MSYYNQLNEAIKNKNKMDIYTQSKIKGLEDHVKHQDKIIKGWIEVAKVKDEIINCKDEIIIRKDKIIESYVVQLDRQLKKNNLI